MDRFAFERRFVRLRKIVFASLGAFCGAVAASPCNGRDFILGSSSSQDAIALMMRVDQGFKSDFWTEKFLNTVFCDKISNAQNEFERRDIIKNLVSGTRALAEESSGVVTNIKISYQLGEYDFQRGGFPVVWGAYGWENARVIYDLLGANRGCWRGAGSIGGDPSAISFFPEDNQIRRFVPLPEDKAREIISTGRPFYRLQFDLAVKTIGSGPLGRPKWNWAGQMRNLRAALVSPNGAILMEIENGPSKDEILAVEKSKCTRELKSLKSIRDNQRKQANDQERAFGDWAACAYAPKARSAYYDYRDGLKKCANLVEDYDAQMKEVSAGIAAADSTIARSCPRQTSVQPPPPDPRASSTKASVAPSPHDAPATSGGKATYGKWEVISAGSQSVARVAISGNAIVSSIRFTCAADGKFDLIFSTKKQAQFGVTLAGDMTILNPDYQGKVSFNEAKEFVKTIAEIEQSSNRSGKATDVEFAVLSNNKVDVLPAIDISGFTAARTHLRSLCKGSY